MILNPSPQPVDETGILTFTVTEALLVRGYPFSVLVLGFRTLNSELTTWLYFLKCWHSHQSEQIGHCGLKGLD
jgi:hypothetical protein